jgi:hypothetical protein
MMMMMMMVMMMMSSLQCAFALGADCPRPGPPWPSGHRSMTALPIAGRMRHLTVGARL